MTCAPCYSRHISRAYPSGCGRRFSRFPFPAHQDLLCRKGKSVYRSALRLSDKLHWPTVSAFCSTLAANRICRTTCNIGWQKQKVCCAFFLLDVPTRILYLEFSADGQLTFCAASNRVPQLLRSALWNTREPTILTSGTLTAAGDFDHTEQLLGLAAYAPLRHFRAESPFNYRKKMSAVYPCTAGSGCSRKPVPCRQNRAACLDLPRSRAGVVHILPPDAQCLRRAGRTADVPCISSRARAEPQYPAIQAIRQRCAVCGWLLLGGH